jgi:hypothetical protein
MLLREAVIMSLLLTALSADSLGLMQTSPNLNSGTQSKSDIILASLSNLQVVAAQELMSLQGTSQAASLQEKYQAAEAAHEACVSLSQQGQSSQVVSKGLEAMALYRAMLEAASLNHSDPNLEASERIIFLKTAANRLIKTLLGIESRVAQANKLGYDTAGIESTLTEIRQYLKDASTALEIPDTGKAESLLSTARAELGKLNAKLSNLTDEIQSARAGQYVAAAKQRVTELKTQILANTPKLSFNALSASTTAVDQAQIRLMAAETFYKEGLVNETIQNLVGFSAKEQQAIEILKNSGVTVSSIDTP